MHVQETTQTIVIVFNVETWSYKNRCCLYTHGGHTFERAHTSANSNVFTLFYMYYVVHYIVVHQCYMCIFSFNTYSTMSSTPGTHITQSVYETFTSSSHHSLITHTIEIHLHISNTTHSHTQSIYYSLLTFTDGVLLAQAWNNCGHTSSPSLHSLPRDDVATATQ